MSGTRVIFQQSLAEARRLADRAEFVIEAQKRIVASQTKAGSHTGQANKTLAAFEEAQDLRLGHIDWILATLARLPLADDI